MEGIGYTKQDLAEEFMTISVIKITVFGMQFVKSINLRQSIMDYLQGTGATSGLAKFSDENQWLLAKKFDDLCNQVKFDLMVNDNMDVCVRMRYQ